MKKLRLQRIALSKDAISEIAAMTLTNGGFVPAGAQPKEPEIGDPMSDGTIYAGVSPTGTRMFAMPADAPLTMTFNHAIEYARKLNSEEYLGHDDWRLPRKGELNVLFNNRAAIGGFDLTGSGPAGWYWSATPYHGWSAWCQRFSDGAQGSTSPDGPSSVRLVR